MKTGWRLIAKLGPEAPHYPHVLAEEQGWALQLGPIAYSDLMHFSSFPNLLEGLFEYCVRQRLGAEGPIVRLDDLAVEVRKEIARVRELCQAATREVDCVARQACKEAI